MTGEGLQLSAWRVSYTLNETGVRKGWARTVGTRTEELYGTEKVAQDAAARLADWGITDDVAVEFVVARLHVGTVVEVHAFARPRVGIVTSLGRSRVTVRFLRNQQCDVDQRAFNITEFYSVAGESLLPLMRPRVAQWDRDNLRKMLGLAS